MTKFETIHLVVKKVAEQLNVDLIEAASRMQGVAAKNGNERMVSDLSNFKLKVSGIEI